MKRFHHRLLKKHYSLPHIITDYTYIIKINNGLFSLCKELKWLYSNKQYGRTTPLSLVYTEMCMEITIVNVSDLHWGVDVPTAVSANHQADKISTTTNSPTSSKISTQMKMISPILHFTQSILSTSNPRHTVKIEIKDH